ncbi:WD repeat protein [Catovirus CTV1]|uniref:WD repeat protein n=1 Tax=Catovirus CTV1 TaxID=1977631 RepID=A0A1V0SAV5_9VIRU|nr:WD repeat protein [Catovirus CTV1]
MEFNQDKNLIALQKDNEIKVFNVDPFVLKRSIEIPPAKFIKLHYRTNLVFFVGSDNNNPANTLNIYDASLTQTIKKIQQDTDIVDVQSNTIYLSLLSNSYICVFKIDNCDVIDWRIPVINNNYYLGSKYLIYIDKNSNDDTEIIKIKNISSNNNMQSIKAHQNKIKFMTTNKQETLLATASERGTIIRIFDIEKGEKVHELRRGTSSTCIQYICFSDDSQYLAVLSDRGTIHIYNLTNPTLNRKSVLSLLGGYFDSDWSFAWYFDEPFNKTKKCCFNKENELLIFTENNSCQKLFFDLNAGGLCVVKDYT